MIILPALLEMVTNGYWLCLNTITHLNAMEGSTEMHIDDAFTTA